MPFAPPQTAPPVLWAKLEALDLDGGAALSFSKRLARDNGWTAAFAQRVVLEYKRFVYLAATCGHPVTPSDEVDQAWHLHLVYTRSYWDELCGQVLGFPLHHGPTKGGAAEGHKFQDWYARTLQSYTAAFGTLPPADIWPEATVRFGEAPYYRRVNLRRHWLLPRLRWPFRLGRREGLGLLVALALVGCTSRLPLNPFNWYGSDFLMLFGVLCATLLPAALWLRHWAAGPLADYAGPPLGTYELARLADHGRRVADCAIAALVHTGQAELVPERRIRRTAMPPPTDPYERAVWNLIPEAGATNLDLLRKKGLDPNSKVLQDLDDGLKAKGVLFPARERARLDGILGFTALGLALFGLVKVLVGLYRHRPVGLLLLLLLGLGFGTWSVYRNYGTWATGRGRQLLLKLVPALRQAQVDRAYSGQLVALCVAVFGITELAAFGMRTLVTYMQPPPQSDGGSGGDSGGSGCGSSGCGGGGCGGCGGCGS
ncbi:TIGR04222 domain-containing membrane protein [Hymenobacter negativus]|uniref:TIGR04222 domain-containing membrane protein n=1 Tax=Hymenobacter negativus TaxID=2795026 RepID=A0ABS3QN87_9BACT|nr:TIGR04222 domain-containing membrane protein [Hymenobacter negativus]MBO2012701.1 TIGR04222 domain-containing membrane protein [Hymenobacter negativus]